MQSDEPSALDLYHDLKAEGFCNWYGCSIHSSCDCYRGKFTSSMMDSNKTCKSVSWVFLDRNKCGSVQRLEHGM